jgi:hypothetical protein
MASWRGGLRRASAAWRSGCQSALEMPEALEGELAPRPGAMSRAIWAASIRKVPLPHIGSHRASSPGFQPCQAQDAGGQVLLQRRLDRGLLEAALVERLARGVEIQRDRIGRQEGVDAHVRLAWVSTLGPPPATVRKVVAHRVLDAQGDELQAAQRRLVGGDEDADGLITA